MKESKKCPFCGEIHEVENVERGRLFRCSNGRNYYVQDSVCAYADDITKQRRLNAIYEYIEIKPYLQIEGVRKLWKFYYDENEMSKLEDEYVNVYLLMQEYPADVAARIDRILLNLAQDYPLLSEKFTLKRCMEKFRRFYCESKAPETEIRSILSMLSDLGNVKCHSEITTYDDEGPKYSITAQGWKKVSQLRKANEVKKQGFIAMSFDPSIRFIEDCFKMAISAAGYTPQIIKEKEHNNYIMPEIFYEIRQSKFVVVDVTLPNYGAYYEAGYALALGKEVIFCCEEKVFKNEKMKPHFDVIQKSMIVWKDKEDLVERLKNRITATVNI